MPFDPFYKVEGDGSDLGKR